MTGLGLFRPATIPRQRIEIHLAMPNVPILRQIAALRGLVFKARDAGSPASADVLTMAAHAVQGIASVEERMPVHKPEHAAHKLRRNHP